MGLQRTEVVEKGWTEKVGARVVRSGKWDRKIKKQKVQPERLIGVS
jgi:hypothetical protein